jgi:hypothetical protein
MTIELERLEKRQNKRVPVRRMSGIVVRAVACEASRDTRDAYAPRAAMNHVDAIKSQRRRDSHGV